MKYDFLCPDIERIAREAGRIILGFGAFNVEEKEGHANFVTDADCAVQDYLFRVLSALLPASSAKRCKSICSSP